MSVSTGTIATMNGAMKLNADAAAGALVLVSGRMNVSTLTFFVPRGGNSLWDTATMDFQLAILDQNMARVGEPGEVVLKAGQEGLIRVKLPSTAVLEPGVYYFMIWRGTGTGSGEVRIAAQGGVPKNSSLRWSKHGVTQGIPSQVQGPGASADVPWIGATS